VPSCASCAKWHNGSRFTADSVVYAEWTTMQQHG
jgi:hypothetical protein